MRKSIFTSLLVLAAVVLFTVPTQAQTAFATKAKANATNAITGKKVFTKADQQKAKNAIAFEAAKAAKAAEAEVLAAAPQAAPEQRVDIAGYTPAQWFKNATLWANPQSAILKGAGIQAAGSFIDDLPKGEYRFVTLSKGLGYKKPALKAGPRTVQGDPSDIITEVPATAEVKTYARSGSYHAVNTQTGVYSLDSQSGYTEIAFDGDDVYIKNPIAGYSSGTWIKGTKDGNTLTVPLGQFLFYSSSDGYGLYITLAEVSTSEDYGFTGTNLTTETEITYTIDGNTISLNGTDETKVLTVAWSDDNTVYTYAAPGGNYGTVYTFDDGYVPPTAQTELIELPASVTAEDWYAEGTNYYPTNSSTPTAAKVAFDGNDVYVSGIFTNLPSAWIKGTLAGNKVTFVTGQLLGQLASGGSTYNVYSVGYKGGEITNNFTMTYDADAKTLTLDEDYDILANISVESLGYFQWIQTLVISAEAPAPTQIDELPYSNDFDDADSQKLFTVIDVNDDGSTWSVNEGAYRYKWSTANVGDDWLVSPAIKLVAGKKYHFAIDAKAQTANWAEKFEVKAATEATAEALAAGTTVIEEQTITNATFNTFENEAFTVAADGYYYIGIHATSDADKYYLTVDNFLIEAAPLTAPVTLDLTQDGSLDNFAVVDNNGDGKTWVWSEANGIYYSYSSTQAADDYLILPIKLEAGKNYNVIVEAAAQSATFGPEKFEIVAGTSADIAALTTQVLAEQTVASTEFSEFEGSLTTTEAGTYYIAVHATSAADKWYLKLKSITVEAGAEGDAPAAVENFTVTPTDGVLEATITFNAPTKAIDGSDLAADGITKIEILRDGAVINTIDAPAPGAALTYTDNDAALTLGNHTYQAITYGASGIGGKSDEVTVFLSAILTVPQTFDLSQKDVFETFQVINNNEDGTSSTWRWDATYATYYTYSSSNDADDYLVAAPIKLEAGKSYLVTVSARSYSANYPERFEVVYGKEATAAGLNKVALAATDVANAEYEDFDGEFSVTEDGNYYVAIHAISDKDMWRLQVNKLIIEKGAEPTAPAAAADFTATAGAEGALEANLAFTAPSTAVNGTNLTGNVDVKIYRDDVLVNTLTDVAAGSAQTWKDTNVEDGQTYTYYIVAANASGDGQKSEKVSVYVGQDEPGDIENFAVAGSTPTTVSFTWDEVAGKNGGYINTAGVKYHIYTLQVLSNGYWQYLDIVDELTTVTGATTATVDFPVDEDQSGYQYFGISAEVAGAETDATAAYTYLIVGAPEEIPVLEGFAGNQLHYNWNTNGGLYISTLDSDGDGTALNLISEEDNTTIYFQLDKVNLTTAQNPTLLFDVHSGNINQVRVIGAKDAGTPSVLQTVSLTDEWQTVKVNLNDIQSGRSTVGFEADFVESSYVSQYGSSWGDTLLVDNIKIIDFYQYNLSAAISAPKTVKAGETATIKATVKNEGEEEATGYTVTIKADDKVLLEETVNEALASFETKEFTAELETTIFDDAADVTLTATVEYANDLNPDDDAAEAVLSIKEPTAAQPGNVTGTDKGDEGVQLSWTAPDNATEEVTDDVESYDDNANGGLFENEEYKGQTGQIGEWTVYDGNNGLGGYGFEGLTSDLGNPGSWIVFNPLAVDASLTNYTAHSGDKYFISASVDEPDGNIADTDNWLISPELPGVAQTISFFTRELVTSYGAETYEVLASSTDKQISSFTKIADKSIATADWTEESFDLPAGTKYFAIRHTSNDVWALLVDDITYLQGGGDVAGYNIYYNGELIATVEGDVTTYLVDPSTIEAGDQTFAVSAVYGNGVESKPVEVSVTVTTAIQNIVVSDSKPADVYSLDGKLVRQQAKSLDGLKGVYVVNGKTVILK